MSSTQLTITDTDPAHYLKIAGQGAGLSTHAELWRWLQGDVQQLLAHEVMLIGWGDFRSGQLHYDIVSSLPGMRTHLWTVKAIAPLISYLRDCWAAAQQLPCQLDISACTELIRSGASGNDAMQTMSGMRTALVHGISGGSTSQGERIFAALGRMPARPSSDCTALKLLLPFIDTALRRIAPQPLREGTCENTLSAQAGALSHREHQIMNWVALGKTNPEIGCILGISEFTVKNHLKSVFSKLDVTNRAQAVAQLNRVIAHA